MIAPRIFRAPAAESSLGREAADLYRQVTGNDLDPEQQFVLERSLGVRPDGKWASFEVAVNEARQNGKNEIGIARQLAGLFLVDANLLIHSAHEAKTSHEHQRRLEHLIQDAPDLHKRVKRNGYRHAHGEESIELVTGQRIRFMTRTKVGGLGHTGDEVYFDEAMNLPAAMIAALLPTMSARSVQGNPQLWYFFTAVDQTRHDHGQHAASLRRRALAADDEQLAYFEWSAHVGDPDRDSPERLTVDQLTDSALWSQANPALGVRISEQFVRNEIRTMGAREFAVERLGIGDWPAEADAAGAVFSFEAWSALADAESRAEDPVCFGFEVRPDRSFAAIGAAGLRADRTPHVELVEYRRGTGWLVGRMVELVASHRPVGVVANGGREPLVAELERAGVEVTTTSAAEYVQTCAQMLDLVEQGEIRHLGTAELDAAVRAAVKRPLGEAWAFSRSGGVDISALVAVALALWGLRELDAPFAAPMIGFA